MGNLVLYLARKLVINSPRRPLGRERPIPVVSGVVFLVNPPTYYNAISPKRTNQLQYLCKASFTFPPVARAGITEISEEQFPPPPNDPYEEDLHNIMAFGHGFLTGMPQQYSCGFAPDLRDVTTRWL